jgi:hypothetical protein
MDDEAILILKAIKADTAATRAAVEAYVRAKNIDIPKPLTRKPPANQQDRAASAAS